MRTTQTSDGKILEKRIGDQISKRASLGVRVDAEKEKPVSFFISFRICRRAGRRKGYYGAWAMRTSEMGSVRDQVLTTHLFFCFARRREHHKSMFYRISDGGHWAPAGSGCP